MGNRNPPKAIDGWTVPSIYHVIGGLGLAALLAVTPGWHEATVHAHWTLPHASAGARGGRLTARPVFLDDRAVVSFAHALTDAAEAPTRVLLRRRDGSTHTVDGPGGALAVLAANGTVVVAVDVFGAVAAYDAALRRTWRTRALFGAAQAHVAVAMRGDRVYVATAPRDAPPTLFQLDMATGDAAAEQGAVEPPRAEARWPSAWRGAFFWPDAEEGAADAAYDGTGAEAFVRKHLPHAWARAEDTRVLVGEDVVIRGPRGLHAMEAQLFAPLPCDSLVLNATAVVTLKAVDAFSAAPRHKRSRDGGSVVAPCALVGVRGLPPVERHLEASLCHDRGIERTTPAKMGRESKRRAAVHSNLALVDGGDIVIAASRGVVSRIRPDGAHAWQARRGPHWKERDFGGYVVLTPRGVLVVGAADARLYDLENGTTLAALDLPIKWDDERVQQAPVLRDDLVLVVTQFQTVALKLKLREDAGAATAKLMVLALALGAVGLVWLASAEMDP